MSTLSKVFLIHGCPDSSEKNKTPETRTYDKHRMPRIEQQLQQQGIEVFRPLMPTPRIENYENFKKEFEKYESFIDEHSILVGHSCGSAFLVRWLGECDKTIKKLILVAPRKIFDDKNQEKIQQKDLYDYEINPELTKRVDEIVMFTADDEDPIGKESLQLFHQALGGNIIELPHHGHFTLGKMGTEAFPELLAIIMK